MKTNFVRELLLFMAITGFTNLTANANDGYFSTGYGAINKGFAGAGIAYYQGSLINGNPAGVVHLGTKYHLGLNLLHPRRKFTTSVPTVTFPDGLGLQKGTFESGSMYAVIPSLGANWMITDNSSFSIALFGNGRMNTTFPPDGFYDASSEFTGLDLAQLFSNLTYSLILSEDHSIGVTATLAYQYFEADGLAAFAVFSESPDKISGNGRSNSLGYGLKVGYLGKLTELLSIGLSYQSRVFMNEFKEYAGLFAENGDFDIPSSWTVGFSLDLTDEFTFMADYKQINYDEVKSISNPFTIDPELGTPATKLGQANGPGFGWENMSIMKVGMAYSGVRSWIFRGGYSYGTNPIPESEVLLNILSPAVITNQVSVGFSKDLTKRRRGRYKPSGKEIHFAFNYALENTIKGINTMDTGQTIEIGMNLLELEMGFSF